MKLEVVVYERGAIAPLPVDKAIDFLASTLKSGCPSVTKHRRRVELRYSTGDVIIEVES